MAWVSRRELARLERERVAALQRAEIAESRLVAERERLDGLVASERQSKDWLVVQMASRVVTKHGGYGLEHEPQPKEVPKPAHPKGFIREPNVYDYAMLRQYEAWAREAGVPNPEEDARAKWEAEMRGEMIENFDTETM